MHVEITFDEVKRETNKAKHALDFADLTVEFFADAIFRDAKLGRFVAVGKFGDEVIAVVVRPLGTEALSVISMRPESRKERRLVE